MSYSNIDGTAKAFGISSNIDEVERIPPNRKTSPSPVRPIKVATHFADVELFLNSILDHKLEYSRQLLKEADLPFTGTHSEIRDRLEEALLGGQLSLNQAIAILREVERWGAQHIYFMRSPESHGDDWNSEVKTQNMLRAKDFANLYGGKSSLRVPTSPEIESIILTKPNLVITIVLPRIWHERDESLDTYKDDTFSVGYRKRTARAVVTFEWNLVTGHAFLTIPQLKKGNGYQAERDKLIQLLSSVVDMKPFQRCSLKNAIKNTMEQDDALIRSLGLEIETGEKVTVKSRSKNNDVFENTQIKDAIDGLKGAFQNDGNFYLPLQNEEAKYFRCRMHPDDRLSLYSQLNEEEVRYVIRSVQGTF